MPRKFASVHARFTDRGRRERLVLRSANLIVGRLRSNVDIDRVQITVAVEAGREARAGYCESAGALAGAVRAVFRAIRTAPSAVSRELATGWT